MVDSNNSINNTIGAEISGETNTLTVTNPSNTASSAARESITVGGGNAADPSLNFNVVGATDWEMGIDNDDSDKFKLSQSPTLGTNDSWIMTTDSQRTMPLQSAFYAFLDPAVTDVTGNTTPFKVVFDNETFDKNSDYDTTTGLFTAPVDGIYFFNTTLLITNLNSAHTEGKWAFFHNTTFQIPNIRGNVFAMSNNDLLSFDSTIIFEMTAGDTMEVQIVVNNGTKTVGLAGPSPEPTTRFSGYLIQ